MIPSEPLMFSFPCPGNRHDELLREVLAPAASELQAFPALRALWFERENKPAWGLRFYVAGEPAWLESIARPLVERSLQAIAPPGEGLALPDVDDKWIGGRAERSYLEAIFFADTKACFALLDAEHRGLLRRSRAEISLRLIERLLDLFELDEAGRLEFDRRGYQWAIDAGRWDAEVLAVLEEKYAAQRDGLRAALDCGPGDDPGAVWGGLEAAGAVEGLLRDAREPVRAILAACAEGKIERPPLDVAIFAAHAHGNRLGVHATQQAVTRWLVRRARVEGGDCL